MTIDATTCQNFDQALGLEWLETNGRGGFASGTVAGANSRRYHALLLTARRPPTDRVVLVNHVEEWLDINGQAIPLSTNLYPIAIHPEGYKQCTGFTIEPWPTWTYDCHGVLVQREILCVRDRDLVVIRWTLVRKTKKGLTLRVRPKLSGRDYHAMHHENRALAADAQAQEGVVIWHPYRELPAVRAFHAGAYRHAPEWYRRIQFELERERGLDYEEDWWSPGEFAFQLQSGVSADLVLTSEMVDSFDATALAESERSRRTKLQLVAKPGDPVTSRLWKATEAYLSERGDRQTVIAGYPWFTDWGRDTFISLPGLCLVTGRHEAAWQVIESFSAHVSEGMVPNRFPDAGEQPEYNTIDASLWFVHAIDRYLTYSKDEKRVRAVAWPAVKQIIDGYRRGTRYNIHMDADGLIAGGVPGAQLTWMDAKVGDWVVTPRHGKPVEIQALWVRALGVGEALATAFGESALAAQCREDRERATASFTERFWYEAGGYLYDVIDGPQGDDATLRPNQLYALSLVDDLVPRDRAQQILHIVQAQLLTPVGLRTVSPRDSRYRARYEGGVVARDGAYHQGTVWPFLLGPFVTAWLKAFGRDAKSRVQARSFLDGLGVHLQDACLGQVSEIFDAAPPHNPRGCPAQAWSVAEPLRAMFEDLGVTIDAIRTRVKTVVVRQVRGKKRPSKSQPRKRRGATKKR
jgi:predicted glycogen debranching enzyme